MIEKRSCFLILTGIILADKPAGFTSFDAVAKLRRVCGTKKIGHAGTLDPAATGVLPIFTHTATRLIPLLPDHNKVYRTVIKLGVLTDTLDARGLILREEKTAVTAEEFAAALHLFFGKQVQTPPMFSAVKVNGQRLYSAARRGEEIIAPPREIEIFDISLINADEENQSFTVSVSCSRGTYIRQLAADIAVRLGTVAHLTLLRRTMACGFTIEQCAPLLDIAADAEKYILPPDEPVKAYPSVFVSPAQEKLFRNGGQLFLERLRNFTPGAEFVRVYGGDRFIGMGAPDEERGILKIKCVF
ncbi:MAG: tRNA pseudouridine(55) synthase TruB [Oscillospiraceae bacterium]|jgi:tRNA pseudouridine55 synthase|nr:tRNA pseudouridine(55) synthase TruB [Oscillospiraceae bacterium]